jgi:hypothetical protein
MLVAFLCITLLIGAFALLAAAILNGIGMAKEDAKPCPCCGKSIPKFGYSTCYECRSTFVNRK